MVVISISVTLNTRTKMNLTPEEIKDLVGICLAAKSLFKEQANYYTFQYKDDFLMKYYSDHSDKATDFYLKLLECVKNT